MKNWKPLTVVGGLLGISWFVGKKFDEAQAFEAESKMECPPATKDVAINTKNRNATIKNFGYGPLNVEEPGDFWKDIAKQWKTTEKAAKKSKCGNCVAFDRSPRMKDCMPGETSDGEGVLGYCWMHHFKCHSARTCDTWAKGGPITTDKVSEGWQERAFAKPKASKIATEADKATAKAAESFEAEEYFDCGCVYEEMMEGAMCESCGHTTCIDCSQNINTTDENYKNWKCYEGYGCNKGDESFEADSDSKKVKNTYRLGDREVKEYTDGSLEVVMDAESVSFKSFWIVAKKGSKLFPAGQVGELRVYDNGERTIVLDNNIVIPFYTQATAYAYLNKHFMVYPKRGKADMSLVMGAEGDHDHDHDDHDHEDIDELVEKIDRLTDFAITFIHDGGFGGEPQGFIVDEDLGLKTEIVKYVEGSMDLRMVRDLETNELVSVRFALSGDPDSTPILYLPLPERIATVPQEERAIKRS